MRKILAVGMILFLTSACLPHSGSVSEKSYPPPSFTKEEESLSPQTELKKSSPPEIPISSKEPSPSHLTSSTESQMIWSLDFPISDESNDDFSLEVLPKHRPKKAQEFDIPIVINAKVEQFIQYFQTTARKAFSNWLARSEKYIPSMRNLLKENGLPEDLVYMALIESGFNPYAYSRSKASGPWQFIYLTGKKYGLRSDLWIDERRDPEKSTVAAAKYLKDLYDMFECWYLAAAGYNAGEKKIAAAMRRYRTEDFWELTKYRYLKQETKDYVPQMIAAALIAKNPEKYGFVDIEYEESLRYEKVKVPELTDLRLIARACETTADEIKDLNPELRRGVTPPNEAEYEIKIPYGTRDCFLKNFEALQPLEKFQFKTHIVRRGETLPRIAKLYRVEVEPMLEMNRLERSSQISKGMTLVIPISKREGIKPLAVTQKEKNGNNRNGRSEGFIYTIKKGDTLWSIANEMGVNIGALSRWNNLHPEKKLIPGDKLKIRMTDSAEEPSAARKGKEIIYTVKQGDTLWSIAQKYNVTVSEIRSWNHLDGSDRIYPSEKLKLRVGEAKSSTLN
jgi:membrane-bound lytic murein transglycosylase D